MLKGIDVADLQSTDHVILTVGQGHGFANFERACQRLINRERNRDGPGILVAGVNEYLLVEHSVERLPRSWVP